MTRTLRIRTRHAALADGSPAARTYAIIALYSRRPGGAYDRPLRDLARLLRLAPSTILRALRLLTRRGYVEDLGRVSPGVHAPHIYRITGKTFKKRGP